MIKLNIYIRNLKVLNLRLIFEKVHIVIKFNQKAWLKSYIMNAKLRKKAKKKIYERASQDDE